MPTYQVLAAYKTRLELTRFWGTIPKAQTTTTQFHFIYSSFCKTGHSSHTTASHLHAILTLA